MFVKCYFKELQRLRCRSKSFCSNEHCLQYSTSQPLPRRRHDNRRRGNSLTLYHTAVSNCQLRRTWNKSPDKTSTSTSPATPPTNSSITPTTRINDSLDILRESCSKLHTKNIGEMSTSTAADGNSGRGLSIDDSLDILWDSSDTAVVPVSSIDSGRSSCQSNVLPAYQQSPSYFTVSAQSAPTMSPSSSFNDLRPNCFSHDGWLIISSLTLSLLCLFLQSRHCNP